MDEQGDGRAAAPRAASSASQPVAIKTEPVPTSTAPDPRLSEISRLFIVCGRGRKVDDLRALFSTYGAIKHLHLALDRSKKSRGFAFLQYEDPAYAAVAIDKLDHLELEDGHILKVTVAKERPVGGNGKLKRDQHARQDQHEKTSADEDDGGIEARLPGKRQRSSPPVTALPLGPSRVSPAFVLEPHPLEGFGADYLKIKAEAQQIKVEVQTSNGLLAADACKDELMEPDEDEKQVQQVLDAMVTAMEQKSESKLGNDLFAAYQLVSLTSDGGGKQRRRGKSITVVVPATSEEALATSIRSVSLAATPMTTRGPRLDFVRNLGEAVRDGTTMPPRPKHHLRRRRQSLDGSGSSAEDGSDGSGIRRKRSNTTTSPPPTLKAHLRQPLSPARAFSDRSDISLSPEALKGEFISKKVGKRQSSDNTIEESYRLAKLQATQERRDHGAGMVDRGSARPTVTDADSSYGIGRNIKLEFKTEPAEPVRTKLFFTSTYKFTEQELEAMFAVYGNFESVELVKSFGRVKTMAYVRYSKSSTAAFVVRSFRDESSQGEESTEKSEFMTLSFAHETIQMQQRSRLGFVPKEHWIALLTYVPVCPAEAPLRHPHRQT